MTTTTVSSEVHQDLLFLDSIGGDIFQEQQQQQIDADQQQQQQQQQDSDEITTRFTTSTPLTDGGPALEFDIGMTRPRWLLYF